MTKLDASGPIEVWLTQKNLEVTCSIVHEDESTTGLDVDSLSMRGAQREITGWLIAHGYEPAGRWQDEVEASRHQDEAPETSRRFRPAKAATAPVQSA